MISILEKYFVDLQREQYKNIAERTNSPYELDEQTFLRQISEKKLENIAQDSAYIPNLIFLDYPCDIMISSSDLDAPKNFEFSPKSLQYTSCRDNMPLLVALDGLFFVDFVKIIFWSSETIKRIYEFDISVFTGKVWKSIANDVVGQNQ